MINLKLLESLKLHLNCNFNTRRIGFLVPDILKILKHLCFEKIYLPHLQNEANSKCYLNSLEYEFH